jgi:hypothetical protein
MWMDMQPLTPIMAGPGGSSPLTDAQLDIWVSKYASLMIRSASAVKTAGLTDSVSDAAPCLVLAQIVALSTLALFGSLGAWVI